MNETIELEEMNIIIKVPTEAVSLTVNAKVMSDDGEIYEVQSSYSPSQLRDARHCFLDEVELGDDFDTTHVFTEKGLEYARMLREGAIALEDLYD